MTVKELNSRSHRFNTPQVVFGLRETIVLPALPNPQTSQPTMVCRLPGLSRTHPSIGYILQVLGTTDREHPIATLNLWRSLSHSTVRSKPELLVQMSSAICFYFSPGTAIYVFTIAADLTLTDVNFTLDGTQIGRYTEFYNMSESFAYNNSILSLNNIPYGEHSLTVDAFGPNQTLVLFDYALYT